MMNENAFFKIIATTLAHTSLENDLVFDEFLIQQLAQKKDTEIAQFHLRLSALRKKLDTFEINKVARKLEYYSSREVYNRFCNGIIASGKDFYRKSTEDKDFLIKKAEKNPSELKRLYYEGFNLVSSAAFYEKKGIDADWDSFLRNEKRLLEIQSKAGKDQELEK
jgi:hypothetical protein